MSTFLEIFKQAVKSGDANITRNLILIDQRLAYSDEAEAYLKQVAMASTGKDIKRFKVLFTFGEWWLTPDTMLKNWGFLNEESYKVLKSYIESHAKKQPYKKVTENQAGTLSLGEAAYDWLSKAIYLLTGEQAKFCDRTLRFEGKTPVLANHLRIQLPMNNPARAAKCIATLELFGIHCYAEGMSNDRSQRYITIPQNQFINVIEAVEVSYLFDRENPQFNILDSKYANDLAPYLFDACFSEKSFLLKEIRKRLDDDKVSAWVCGIEECGNLDVWDNLKSHLSQWQQMVGLPFVPEWLLPESFDHLHHAKFKSINASLGLPKISREMDIDSLTPKQKATLFRICVKDDWAQALKVEGVEESVLKNYRTFVQQSLSIFLPDDIQKVKELPAHQPSLSFSWDRDSQEDAQPREGVGNSAESQEGLQASQVDKKSDKKRKLH